MTSMAVPAKSLSSLTTLAFNPPSYPRNPTHLRHDPLVLYIARVPGSKDVFLSPMKPRDKVVTAEDIQSSLYFVHVELPEDANLIDPAAFHEPGQSYQRPNPANRSSAPLVQRKAVPNGAPVASPARKPVPSSLAPVTDFESRQNVNAGQYAHRSEMLGPNYSPRRSYDSTRSQAEEDSTFRPRTSAEYMPPAGTSLTLIRRDPASGAQWNVARIEDPAVVDVSSAGSATKRKIGAPMYIEVSNPGYSKFLHSNNETSSLSHNHDPSLPLDRQPGEQPAKGETVFRRRLWMEGTQHTGGFGHRKTNSSENNYGRPRSHGNDGSSVDLRLPSSPTFLTRPDQTYSTLQVSDRPSGFRGYVFTSPWNGRCEFITGAGGSSLKCRHIVPGLQGGAPAAMPVSELRLNLPGSTPAQSPRVDEHSSKRSSFFHRGRHSRNNSSLSVNRDATVEDARTSLDRMDLSLGQEFAGGGFGGKQAKLGKIVVEDEGIKMMDLLVAVNVGLWWRAYEKSGLGARG